MKEFAKLRPIEIDALKMLLAPENSEIECLRRQIAYVHVLSREYTGCGVFVKMDVSELHACPEMESLRISKVAGELSGLSDGFGVNVIIENGRLNLLEFATFGDEDWPEAVRDYTFSYIRS